MKPESFGKVPISKIFIHENIRTVFDDEKLSELAESIKQRGVLHPITCRKSNGKLELIAGERRLRAAKMAGLTEIPTLIREADDTEVAYDQIIENLQREELTDEDEFNALKSLRDMGLAITKISKMTGLSSTTIQRVLVLESLKPAIRGRSDITKYQKAFIARAPEYVHDVLAERSAEGVLTSAALGHDVMPTINKVKEEEFFSQEEKERVIVKIAEETTKDHSARTILWQAQADKKLERTGLDVEISSLQDLRALLESSQWYYQEIVFLQTQTFEYLDFQRVTGIVDCFRRIHEALEDILERIEEVKEGYEQKTLGQNPP